MENKTNLYDKGKTEYKPNDVCLSEKAQLGSYYSMIDVLSKPIDSRLVNVIDYIKKVTTNAITPVLTPLLNEQFCNMSLKLGETI